MKMQTKIKWLALPFISGFLMFYVLPFLFSFYYAAIESPFSRRFVGLDNFIRVFGNKYYRLALTNTFEFTLIGMLILVLLALAEE